MLLIGSLQDMRLLTYYYDLSYMCNTILWKAEHVHHTRRVVRVQGIELGPKYVRMQQDRFLLAQEVQQEARYTEMKTHLRVSTLNNLHRVNTNWTDS